jgi:hypothetical protein
METKPLSISHLIKFKKTNRYENSTEGEEFSGWKTDHD